MGFIANPGLAVHLDRELREYNRPSELVDTCHLVRLRNFLVQEGGPSS